MIWVAADNQWLVLQGPGLVQALTLPQPLADADRASAILTAHSLFGAPLPAINKFSYFTESSIDGVSWVSQGPSDSVVAATPPQQVISTVTGRLLRVRFQYQVTGAAASCGVLFSLTVNLDRA